MPHDVPAGEATPEPQPHPGFTAAHRDTILRAFEERGLFGPRKTPPSSTNTRKARHRPTPTVVSPRRNALR